MTTAPSTWRTAGELADRRKRLSAPLRDLGLDGVVLTGSPSRLWFSGYGPDDDEDHLSHATLVDARETVQFVPATNRGWAESASPGVTTRAWSHPRYPTLADAIRAAGWKRVGFEGNRLSVSAWKALSAALGDGVELVDVDVALADLRLVKTPAEIDTLREAARITDLAFVAMRDEIRAGMTERQVARRLDQLMVEAGADEPGFPTIVAAGRNASRPHHAPGTDEIRHGEPIIVDMGARFDAYTADLTRTIWVGDPDERLTSWYPIVSRANDAARGAVRAGATGASVDQAAIDVITDAGIADGLLHGVGHGVGIQIHEAPWASVRIDTTLVAGSALTIEPGIYFPDWGGIRIEDLVIITDNGSETISHAPKERLESR